MEDEREQLIIQKTEIEETIEDLDTQIEELMGPLMNKSEVVSQRLDKSDIATIKSLKNPPQITKDVMQGVAIAFGKKENWNSYQSMLSDKNFVSNLYNYDKENMSEKLTQKLDDHIQEKDLSYEKVNKASSAVSGIYLWLEAIVQYQKSKKELEPLEEQRIEAKRALTQTLIELNSAYYAEGEIKHAGLQTTFDGQKHIVHFQVLGENGQPQQFQTEVQTGVAQDGEPYNQENELRGYLDTEGEEKVGDGTIQDEFGSNINIQNESLYFISNEIKKRDQSKKFVLWETTELRNQWDGKLKTANKSQAFDKTNSHHWTHEPNEKSVSVIDSAKTKAKVPPPKAPLETGDALAKVPKKDHELNNVFLQSNLQHQKLKKRAPWSHDTFNKHGKPKNYEIEGRPLFEGQGNHVQNISAGRSRIFYSSNVF